jgi:hypothetical protein
MFPTLLAMGEAPTIAMERGSKKALSFSFDWAILPANKSGVFELGQIRSGRPVLVQQQSQPCAYPASPIIEFLPCLSVPEDPLIP